MKSALLGLLALFCLGGSAVAHTQDHFRDNYGSGYEPNPNLVKFYGRDDGFTGTHSLLRDAQREFLQATATAQRADAAQRAAFTDRTAALDDFMHAASARANGDAQLALIDYRDARAEERLARFEQHLARRDERRARQEFREARFDLREARLEERRHPFPPPPHHHHGGSPD